MTRTTGLLVLSAAALSAAFAAGGWAGHARPGDEDAIKARLTAFAAAWAKDDAAAMAALWSQDGDLINPWGRVAKGRPAVEALFKDEHTGALKQTTWEFKLSGVRTLGNVAIADMDGAINGMKGPDGAALPPFPHHVTFVYQKSKDGTWMIEAARPYAFLPAPSAGSPAKTAKP